MFIHKMYALFVFVYVKDVVCKDIADNVVVVVVRMLLTLRGAIIIAMYIRTKQIRNSHKVQSIGNVC